MHLEVCPSSYYVNSMVKRSLSIQGLMQHPARELQSIELVVVCHRGTISHSTLYKKDVFKKKRIFDSSLHLSYEAVRH